MLPTQGWPCPSALCAVRTRRWYRAQTSVEDGWLGVLVGCRDDQVDVLNPGRLAQAVYYMRPEQLLVSVEGQEYVRRSAPVGYEHWPALGRLLSPACVLVELPA